MEDYNGRARRAMAMKGGIDYVPVPSWMSQSQTAGRSASKQQPDDSLAVYLHVPNRFRLSTPSTGLAVNHVDLCVQVPAFMHLLLLLLQ